MVHTAFSGLNNKRKEIAFEEKHRTEKLAQDLHQVKEFCAKQMGARSHQEEVIANKTREAKDRSREARQMSRAQKDAMKTLVEEVQRDIQNIETYKINIEEMYICGLTAKAKKIIGEKDSKIQARIKEARESIQMMMKEIETGKERLNSYK